MKTNIMGAIGAAVFAMEKNRSQAGCPDCIRKGEIKWDLAQNRQCLKNS
jgi:hypothetical protein